ERIKESLARLKANGKKLGRPLGAKSKILKLEKNQKKLENLLSKGLPKAQIARLLGVDRSTLYYYLKKKTLNSD
ncbi:MAG: helix-turn-helix domain-containing protein, partial [Alphaproteobacteria bacterium]|nr:helix-turn-helix domain-containing protein [Alphaproteobacteria bacterium]